MIHMNKMLSQAAAVERYGEIDLASRHWPDMGKWMTLFEIPKNKFPHFTIMDTKIPVTHIACNRDILNPLRRAFDSIINRSLENELWTYDGCLSIRAVRGHSHLLSTHSYGLAVDLNAATNGLGEKGNMSEAMVRCFTEEGFDWGGHFPRLDGMHYSYAWEGR